MAKKKKEVCPYCGKTFAYLSRHKCKIKERVEGVEEDKSDVERRTERIKETKKNVQRTLKKDEKIVLDIINKRKSIYFEDLLKLTNKDRTDLDTILEILNIQSKIEVNRELLDSSWTKNIKSVVDYSKDVKVKGANINMKKKDFIWNLFNFQPCFICPYSIDRCNETNPTKLNPQHCPWLTYWMIESIKKTPINVNPADFDYGDFEDREKI